MSITSPRTRKRIGFMARKFIEDTPTDGEVSREFIRNIKRLSNESLLIAFQRRKLKVIRDELFARYRHRAFEAASLYVKKRMPYRSLLDYKDIVSHAEIGLLDAIHSYEPGHNTTFDTWAYTRIRGSIIDGLRSVQCFPRIIARIKRELAPLQCQLAQVLHRDPSSEELIEAFPDAVIAGGSIELIRGNALLQANVYNQNPQEHWRVLMANADTMESDEFELEVSLQRKVKQPHESMQRIDFISKINSVIDDWIEQQVILMYYFGGNTYTEIGINLGMSAAWVSVKKLSALEKLRREARLNYDFCEELRGM